MVIHIELKPKYFPIDHMELAGTLCPPNFSCILSVTQCELVTQ